MNLTTEPPPAPEHDTMDVLFGVLDLVFSVSGLILNSLTLKYFCSKIRSPTHFLYLCIVIVDIFSCLSVFPSGVSMLTYRKPVILANNFVCITAGWVLNITTRMSVFLVAVLSVLRCVFISPSCPNPALTHAILPVLGYLLIQIFQASLPLLFSTHQPPIHYSSSMGGCGWGIAELSFSPYEGGHGVWYRALTYCCVILPSFLPLFPVVVSCGVFVKIVFRSRRRLRRHRARSEGKGGARSLISRLGGGDKKKPDSVQQATTTMYIVTLLYIVFNVPFWTFCLIVMFCKPDHFTWISSNGRIINIFLSRTSVVMNAACNPCVYFARIRALQEMWRCAARRTGDHTTRATALHS